MKILDDLAYAVLIFFGLAFSLMARAASDRPLPVFESGVVIYSGDQVSSLSGSQGYLVQFNSEESRGTLRPFVGVQFDYSMGTAYVDSTELAYTMYGGGFLVGYNFFMFDSGSFQPFIGVNGVLGWNMFSVPVGSSIDAYTQGYSYGYEVSGGVDIRLKSGRDAAFRLRGGLWTLTGQIAGSTSFPVMGYRFTAGYMF